MSMIAPHLDATDWLMRTQYRLVIHHSPVCNSTTAALLLFDEVAGQKLTKVFFFEPREELIMSDGKTFGKIPMDRTDSSGERVRLKVQANRERYARSRRVHWVRFRWPLGGVRSSRESNGHRKSVRIRFCCRKGEMLVRLGLTVRLARSMRRTKGKTFAVDPSWTGEGGCESPL